ncbi:hypothetical protein O3M35_000553 [Rhynocoris fuscipes]|uniref:DUF7041 domain-containing protein n=1 Tax=Rhynocoris fuscipes TaxID=488301 RepID=A0AAW1DT02_9HEMI
MSLTSFTEAIQYSTRYLLDIKHNSQKIYISLYLSYATVVYQIFRKNLEKGYTFYTLLWRILWQSSPVCLVQCAPSVAAVTPLAKIPPIWKPDPELLFCQVEAVIASTKTRSSLAKFFEDVVATLKFDVLQLVEDLVKRNTDNHYEYLKQRLIRI